MVVGFPKSEGGWWTLKGTQTIRVYEYGQQCFDNCDPSRDFAECSIEYTEVKVCSASASKSDIEGSSPDGNRDYPGCTHSTTSFTSSGFGDGSPVLPSGN